MKSLILASSSIYRKELLNKLRLQFNTISPDIDETRHDGEAPSDLVLRLAKEKAQAVLQQLEGNDESLIIASDQIAVLGEQILGKPGNRENAIKQLSSMSGKHVSFLTSLALLNSQTQQLQLELSEYHVYFRELSQDDISRYVDKEEPYNCAGSFKSEGYGITLFEKFVGEDPNSLIGLPLMKLVSMLKNEGLQLP